MIFFQCGKMFFGHLFGMHVTAEEHRAPAPIELLKVVLRAADHLFVIGRAVKIGEPVIPELPEKVIVFRVFRRMPRSRIRVLLDRVPPFPPVSRGVLRHFPAYIA